MADRRGLIAVLLALLLLCGCVSSGPDFEPPDPLLPGASFHGKPEPATQAARAPGDFQAINPRLVGGVPRSDSDFAHGARRGR